ncbi:C1 family peptidase [Microbacterium sp. AZCO]|uniref:C1 family peptidase n=1 Tax=Microbacterium sp. AZCO TaxID=3142976 RepID=UPI0031F3D666
MPEDSKIDVSAVRKAVADQGLRWRVLAEPVVRGLGAEDVPADQVAFAEAYGDELIARIKDGDQDVLLNRLIRPDLLKFHFLFRPRRWDWRDRGAIGPVTDQGQCGSCVSFATAGLVGAQAAIELGIAPVDLSEADQHFASAHGANCGGWNNQSSLDEVRRRGIAVEGSFPYMSAFDSPPAFGGDNLWIAHDRTQPLRALRSYGITNSTAHTGDDRKLYLATVGPLIAAFTVYQDFDVYGGGQYSHAWGNVRGGHAVLVIGYDDVEGSWICRNSWGTTWGGPADPDGTGAGFFRIKYGDSNIDNQPMYGARGVRPPLLRPIIINPVRLEELRRVPIPDPGPLRVQEHAPIH